METDINTKNGNKTEINKTQTLNEAIGVGSIQ
jgi:hypothetical protein